MSDTVYWTMKNGQKISVDDMDINHLRNTLKMIIRKRNQPITVKKEPVFIVNGEMASIDADNYIIGEITGDWCECDILHKGYRTDIEICQHCKEY